MVKLREFGSGVNLEDRTYRGALTQRRPYNWYVVSLVSPWRVAFVPQDCRGVASHCGVAAFGQSDSGGSAGIGSPA